MAHELINNWGGAYGMAEALVDYDFGRGDYVEWEGLLTDLLNRWDVERDGYVERRDAREMREMVAEELAEVKQDEENLLEHGDVIIVANRLVNAWDASAEDIEYGTRLIDERVAWLVGRGHDSMRVCMEAVMKNCGNYPEAMFGKDGAEGVDASYMFVKVLRRGFGNRRLPMLEEPEPVEVVRIEGGQVGLNREAVDGAEGTEAFAYYGVYLQMIQG